MATRLYISPKFDGVDQGDGGIRRVVEAQRKYLPELGFEIVDDPAAAELAAVHAGDDARFNGPTVEHCHGLYWKEYEWDMWTTQLNKQVLTAIHYADEVTAVSEWVANILRRGLWIDPTVIYHGIDTEEWDSQKHDNYILWNKTRIDPVCDPQAVDIIASMDTTLQYVSTYAMPGPNIKVTGLLPFAEAKPLIQQAGLYLCTTRETFGIGTLEAMACRVPVVGWRWGGQREIVKHKETGYLATPGDYDDLLYGIHYCLERRDTMGAAARADVKAEFNWPTIMQQYAAVYNRVLSNRAKAHPKVSVIVTNYKLERYLMDCIRSIMAAAGDNLEYEIILVNDASPTWDVSLGIDLDNLAGSKLKIIHNKENQYLARSLNIGITAATGDYILPIDADNMLAPHALEILAGQLDAHKELDIVYGAMELLEENGNRWVSDWPTSKPSIDLQLHHHNQIPSTAMYRKRVWSTAGGYRARCATAEDADFWCRVMSLGFMPQKVTDAVTLIYRDRADSMSHVNKDWAWQNWYTWGRIPQLTPFGAIQQLQPQIPTYEPTLISVVIPCGPGHEKLVVDAIDSLVAQTFQQWECIVVNDTGKDIPWLPPFVKTIKTRPDANTNRPSHARNRGIAIAQAKLFVLLDADDYLAPNALDVLYRTYKGNNVNFVYPDWFSVEDKKRHESPNYKPENYLQKLPHPITGLYEKAKWEEVGGFDEALKGWEDWDFHLKMQAAGACGIRVPLPLLYYRIHAGWRREKLYAEEEKNKAEIFTKYGEYINGRKQLMACGSCGNRPAVAPMPTYTPQSYKPDPTGQTQLVEYTGDNVGPLVYAGYVTGQRYSFGSDTGMRIKYVYTADVPGFVERFPDIFQKFEQGEEVVILEASGAPVQEAPEAVLS